MMIEFRHAPGVRGDGGAFHGDADFLGLFGGVDGDPVAGLVAVFNAKVVIEQVHVEIGMDQLVLDELPDNASHLVAVHFDDRICHFDFRHSVSNLCGKGAAGRPSGGRGRATYGPGTALPQGPLPPFPARFRPRRCAAIGRRKRVI
jgi:hypothetical protein